MNTHIKKKKTADRWDVIFDISKGKNEELKKLCANTMIEITIFSTPSLSQIFLIYLVKNHTCVPSLSCILLGGTFPEAHLLNNSY